MSRILYISATVSPHEPLRDYINAAKEDGTCVDVAYLKRGPRHLTYYSVEALVVADIIRRVRKAEAEGYDGVIIGCFYDPGLREAREISQGMVIAAPAESSMLLAASYGDRFSVLVPSRKSIPQMRENAEKYGLAGRVASFEALDMTVVQLQEDRVLTEERLTLAAQRAIRQANAEVLILGCTREFGFYRVLQDKLGVPVIDGLLAALSYTEHMIRLRERHDWHHSKIGVYARPAPDEGIDWVDDASYHEEVWGLARGDC